MNNQNNDLVAVAITTNNTPKLVYIMELSDAMKFCRDERTSKKNSWMFFFTSLTDYTKDDGKLNTKAVKKDNGFLYEVIDELNLTTYDINELKNENFSYLPDTIDDGTYERAWEALEADKEWMKMDNERELKKYEEMLKN